MKRRQIDSFKASFRVAFFRLFVLEFRLFVWRVSLFRLFAWRYFVFSSFRLASFRLFVSSRGVISGRKDEMSQTSHHSLQFKGSLVLLHLIHVMRKPVLAICEQQKCRSACASAQSDQHFCCSLAR